MKNKKKKILLTLPILIVVILGSLVLTKTVDPTKILGLVNPMDLKSSDVSYTNNSQSTVQGAIDKLYTLANQPKGKNNTVYFAFGEPTTSSTTDYTTLNKKTFVALNGGQKSVCIIRNSRLHCFDNNNFAIEKDHVQQVFSDISCSVSSSSVRCIASGFGCDVDSNGSVLCGGNGSDGSCGVNADGSVRCR